MPIQALPQDYQPVQQGDWRIQDMQDGTFSNAIFVGTWVAMQPIQAGQPVSALIEGLVLLGRRDRIYYYRPETGPGRPAQQWPWTVLKNEGNRSWTAPHFAFGQLVWKRRNLMDSPQVVTGISVVQAFTDYPSPQSEDTDESSPQTWVYTLDYNKTTESTEEDLIGRDELARVLAGVEPVSVPAGDNTDDFDPFLDA